jgi:hypothetical protein
VTATTLETPVAATAAQIEGGENALAGDGEGGERRIGDRDRLVQQEDAAGGIAEAESVGSAIGQPAPAGPLPTPR